MDKIPDPLTVIAHGRMTSVRGIEASLRAGLSYDKTAAKAKLSLTTVKTWARELCIRKADLVAETVEDRRARYLDWSSRLAALGRHDEAGVYEGEAEKLDRLLGRLEKRAASTLLDGPQAGQALHAPVRAFLERVQAATGAPDAFAAWTEISAYYGALHQAGATLHPDGQAAWPDGVLPSGRPDCPGWLPCDPWQVSDEAMWEAGAGGAIRLL